MLKYYDFIELKNNFNRKMKFINKSKDRNDHLYYSISQSQGFTSYTYYQYLSN